ncbi:MAG: hypothetical protein RL757_1243 [Bacteroidota bacterium]|jgi:hypothetical protein
MIYIGNNGGNPLQPRNPFSSLISLLVGVGILVLIYIIIKGFIGFLYWCAPVFLILALVINRVVVFKYAQQLVENFKTDVLKGLTWLVFLVFCYPIVFFWLFIKAIFYNRLAKFAKQQEDLVNGFNTGRFNNQKPRTQDDEWTDYEEIK